MKSSIRNRLPLLVVWVLILAYGIFFSALSIQRHRAFLTHASDLGQIDQAIWNTLHGNLLEHTKATGVQNIRLSDHVEPIFVPLSLVFLLYDNVEALLIVQSFAIALGALVIYWIARERLSSPQDRDASTPSPPTLETADIVAPSPVPFPEPGKGRKISTVPIPGVPIRKFAFGSLHIGTPPQPSSPQVARTALSVPERGARKKNLPSEWAAVGFAAIYLLFPSLEAANLAEFHAVTLAPAPLLFAYHYGTKKAWGRFALFSLLALAVKEEIALLVFTMALWFWIGPAIESRFSFARKLIGSVRTPLARRTTAESPRRAMNSSSPGWNSPSPTVPLGPSGSEGERGMFQTWGLAVALIAALWFVFAVFVVIPHFNTLGRSPYTCRYIISEDCRVITPGLFLPERLGYLAQLLASVGWVALLDPLPLLLGLPLIAANALSNFPAQYSGTFHYSAPVAPYLVLAAIGGSARAVDWLRSRPGHQNPRAALWVIPPVLLLALAFHLAAGYTPVAAAFAWPSITGHNQLFARFAAEIPPNATVSTTGSLNPHLSHRRVLYRYLTVEDADYVLLDVSEFANAPPVDVRVVYNALTDTNSFGVVDAADGYVLLRRGAPSKPLPDEFFSMFRAENKKPQYPTVINFGDSVRFLGYDVLADQYGRGSVRMYWQRLKPIDKNYNLFLFFPDGQGVPREELTLAPTLLFWYPTSMWRENETITGVTVPLDWGPRSRVGLAVLDGNDWQETSIRLRAESADPKAARTFDDSTWVELGIFKKSVTGFVKE